MLQLSIKMSANSVPKKLACRMPNDHNLKFIALDLHANKVACFESVRSLFRSTLGEFQLIKVNRG